MQSNLEQKPAPVRLRFPWHVVVALVFLLLMGFSLSAFADTYNFYFSKKNKHQQEASSDEDSEKKDEDQPPPAAEPKPAPAPAKSDGGQTITTAPGQNPIIVNNYNNNSVGNNTLGLPSNADLATQVPMTPPPQHKAPEPTPLPPVSEPPPASDEHASLSTTAFEPPHEKLSKWKLGVGVVAFSNQSTPMAGELSLGVYFTRAVGLMAYGGAGYESSELRNGYMGLDLEIRPFRLSITDNYDLFQFGFLVGASTLGAVDGNPASAHVGARFDLNLGTRFAVTAATRANLGYVMFEAGIITRL